MDESKKTPKAARHPRIKARKRQKSEYVNQLISLKDVI